MFALVVWVEGTNSCSLEGKGISAGPGKISLHLKLTHINTNWEKDALSRDSIKDFS